MTVRLRTSDDFAARLLADAASGLAEYQSQFGAPVNGFVLDIGAHYGAFTLQALEAHGPGHGVQVLAIEASAVNYAALVDNIIASQRDWWAVPILAAALETDAKTVTLRKAAQGNSGQYSVWFHEGHPISDPAVPVMKFSMLFALRAWSYVKIDVEGAEWSFLNDDKAMDALLAHTQFLDLEIHPLDSYDYFPRSSTPFRYVDEVAEEFRKRDCKVSWSVQHPTRIYVEPVAWSAKT